MFCTRVTSSTVSTAPTAAELDTYRAYLAEENERFPYNFSAVWDELAVQFANNG